MSRFLTKLKSAFLSSPLASLSFLIGFWLFIRILIQRLHPYVARRFPLDLPFYSSSYSSSPIVGPLEMTQTAFVLGGLGVILGIVSVFRRREAWRWWALFAVALNVGAYVVTVSMNLWALSPPPGVEY